MNVRLSDQNIRLRITEAELAPLLSGKPIYASIVFPDKTLLQFQLIAQYQEASITLKREECNFYWGIHRPLLEDLANQVPSKKGITLLLEGELSNPLKVVLEIDVFSKEKSNA